MGGDVSLTWMASSVGVTVSNRSAFSCPTPALIIVNGSTVCRFAGTVAWGEMSRHPGIHARAKKPDSARVSQPSAQAHCTCQLISQRLGTACLYSNGCRWRMCYEQDYRKVTNAEALDLSLPTKSCSTRERAVVIHLPTASVAPQTPRRCVDSSGDSSIAIAAWEHLQHPQL